MLSMAAQCICCGGSLRPIGQKNGFDLLECISCTFLTTSPLPSPEQLSAFYSNEYFVKESGPGDKGYQNILSEAAIQADKLMARERLDIIEHLANGRGALLDSGCAAGTFLSVASERGWTGSGVEINADMRDRAAQVCGGLTFPELEEAIGPYDAITMWEYFEHVLDPARELRMIQQRLKPGGLLCMSFPNIESQLTSAQKQNWLQVKPPEHLHYWSASNIVLLLEQFGFSSVKFRYFGLKSILDGRRRLGSRSDPRTVLWPLMSILSKLSAKKWSTGLIEHMEVAHRRSYEGIEVYARYAE